MTVVLCYDDEDDAVGIVESYSSGTGIGIGLALLAVAGLVLAVRWGSRVQAWKKVVDGKTPGVQHLFEAQPCEGCTFKRTLEQGITVVTNKPLLSAQKLLSQKPWGYVGRGVSTLQKTVDTLTRNQTVMLETLRALDTLQNRPEKMTHIDMKRASDILNTSDKIVDLRNLSHENTYTLSDLYKKLLPKVDVSALEQTLQTRVDVSRAS